MTAESAESMTAFKNRLVSLVNAGDAESARLHWESGAELAGQGRTFVYSIMDELTPEGRALFSRMLYDMSKDAEDRWREGNNELVDANALWVVAKTLSAMAFVRDEISGKKSWALSPTPCSTSIMHKSAVTRWPILGDEGQDKNALIGLGPIRSVKFPEPLFLLSHDWDKVFEGAEQFSEGDILLPFPACSFEMRIEGVPVIMSRYATDESNELKRSVGSVAILIQINDGENRIDERDLDPESLSYAKKTEVFWLPITAESITKGLEGAIWNVAYSRVRAALIAMETEIAETEFIPAPAKLNKARAKKGRSPLRDFYTVNLAKRYRRERSDSETGETGKVRLHFRRGHFAKHPTAGRVWRKWCLVGNPDLGWVDHIYKA